MITAICTNNDCEQHGVERFILRQPTRVECGNCGTDCELTDPRPDPVFPNPEYPDA